MNHQVKPVNEPVFVWMCPSEHHTLETAGDCSMGGVWHLVIHYTPVQCGGGGESTPTSPSPPSNNNDLGGGSNGGSTSPNLPSIEDAPLTPCQKIKNITNKTVGLKPIINNFKYSTALDLNYEKGFDFVDDTIGKTKLVSNNGNPNQTFIKVKLKEDGSVTGYLHTHFNQPDISPVFTIEDVRTLYAVYYFRTNNNKPLEKITVMLVSRAGVFAMVIEDFDKMTLNGSKLHTDEFEKLSKEYYGGLLNNANVTDDDIIKQAIKILPNYGVALYKANDDLSNWDKLTYDSESDEIVPTPCN